MYGITSLWCRPLFVGKLTIGRQEPRNIPTEAEDEAGASFSEQHEKSGNVSIFPFFSMYLPQKSQLHQILNY
jgi:hypothetical protein